MAHEFNNILGVILGNAELVMLDTPEWSHSLDDLKEIVKASLRARDVVKQLLSFSRIEKVKRIPLKPGPVIKESLQLIRASISSYIEVRQEIESDTYTILADSTQLNQVIINLCTNARDAMKEEGGVLEVALQNVEIESRSDKLQPGKYVRLTVRDSGTGIPLKLSSGSLIHTSLPKRWGKAQGWVWQLYTGSFGNTKGWSI